MPFASQMPVELVKILHAWSSDMEALSNDEDRIHYIRVHFPDLLLNTALFVDILKRMSKGEPYPDIRKTEMFDNEILMYLHPKRLFSLRLFLFGPEDFTPIHDHNSWGVIGTAFNPLTVIDYERLDDGSTEGVARIRETRRMVLKPGDTQVTGPLNNGIHATGNASQKPVVMVNVYGSPIRRLYVNGFDPEAHRVYRLYAPRMKKKVLAKETLFHME